MNKVAEFVVQRLRSYLVFQIVGRLLEHVMNKVAECVVQRLRT